jgi:hypothetical protein
MIAGHSQRIRYPKASVIMQCRAGAPRRVKPAPASRRRTVIAEDSQRIPLKMLRDHGRGA